MSDEIVDIRNKKLLSVLGLGAKSGGVIYGVPMICDALREKRGQRYPRLVFEAADTSDNTHKRISDKCTFYRVRLIKLGVGGAELGRALGKSSFLAAVALTNENLSALAERYI